MNKKPNILNNLAFIFPVMGYYLLEALIVGLIIGILWRFFLTNYLGHIGYPQIVIIYWIFKMLFFDVFKLISGVSQMPAPPENEEDKNRLTEKDFK